MTSPEMPGRIDQHLDRLSELQSTGNEGDYGLIARQYQRMAIDLREQQHDIAEGVAGLQIPGRGSTADRAREVHAELKQAVDATTDAMELIEKATREYTSSVDRYNAAAEPVKAAYEQEQKNMVIAASKILEAANNDMTIVDQGDMSYMVPKGIGGQVSGLVQQGLGAAGLSSQNSFKSAAASRRDWTAADREWTRLANQFATEQAPVRQNFDKAQDLLEGLHLSVPQNNPGGAPGGMGVPGGGAAPSPVPLFPGGGTPINLNGGGGAGSTSATSSNPGGNSSPLATPLAAVAGDGAADATAQTATPETATTGMVPGAVIGQQPGAAGMAGPGGAMSPGAASYPTAAAAQQAASAGGLKPMPDAQFQDMLSKIRAANGGAGAAPSAAGSSSRVASSPGPATFTTATPAGQNPSLLNQFGEPNVNKPGGGKVAAAVPGGGSSGSRGMFPPPLVPPMAPGAGGGAPAGGKNDRPKIANADPGNLYGDDVKHTDPIVSPRRNNPS